VIFNPLARVTPIEAEGRTRGIVVEAPIPGRGLVRTEVLRSEDEARYSLVLYAIAGKLAPAKLTPHERELLHALGLYLDRPVRAAEFRDDLLGAARWDRDLAEARASVDERGYAVVRDLVPAALAAGLRDYFRALVDEGHLPLGDGRATRFWRHRDPVADRLHVAIADLVQRASPAPVKPSYSYFCEYVAGSELEKHTDREACGLTLSITIDASPSARREDAWPLCVEDADGSVFRALLGRGDALLFKGRERPHFRERLDDGKRSASLMLHFVPPDFEGSLD
jgi:hypothetical protein